MAENLREKRKRLLMASLPAFAVVVLTAYFTHALFAFVTLPADDPSSRLAFVVECLFGPACTLWIGVQFAGRRFLYRDAIDGTPHTSQSRLGD